MRITGGTGKGRRLKAPTGSRVRPTSDKVRQALFNILGEKVKRSAFLDLYAGTGAIGIEALSRGAERACFVDDSRGSLEIIRQNVEQSGFREQSVVVAARAESFLKKGREQFDIVFLDPPYVMEQEYLLSMIDASAILKPDSIIVAEHFKKQESPQRAGRLSLFREAVYGDTVIAFYSLAGTGRTDADPL